MAQEEEFEFDAAGEALGYIPLDQACVLPVQHARDNRDIHGRRYRRRELVWEVVSQGEGEAYYDISLSYRPARGPQGEPGVDKSSPLRLRQILRESMEPVAVAV